MIEVADELARLATLSPAELRETWVKLCGDPVPNVSPKLLRLALGWEVQARRLGGLSRETVRTLDQLARGATKTAPASAGMRLVREWQGRLHVVTVGEDRIIRWDEREWKSLSEVARAITGTRWSGPAFFGLKKKVAA
ncbi:MAG: DUF2924 domain-containing protein [Sphingomonas adhaesiva]|uniref:DUF2924 domain-containing protein n=1 Tax=Sphingomonas adhaesiva TaxID=28212 RepID=UPI002FFC0491